MGVRIALGSTVVHQVVAMPDSERYVVNRSVSSSSNSQVAFTQVSTIMAFQDEFANNLLRFLKEHALCVNGGSVQALTGGSTVGAAIAAQGIQTTQKAPGVAAKAGVSLGAPLFSPSFAKTRDAENADLLDFSRPIVTVNLGPHVATGLPVYLMPYEGGAARGVRLPAHGSDPYNVAYAMTATLNGCTVEVSGTPASPYASHTNVIDVTHGDAAQKWFAREQKINARLFRLQQRFAAAETAAGGNPAAPPQNRTQFGFYDSAGPGAVAAGRHKNYNTAMKHAGDRAEGQFGKTMRRESKMFGHYRYMCVPTDESIQTLRNRALPPNAVVVGRRDSGGWKFFYQVYAEVGFNIKRQLKMKGIAVGSGEFLMKDDDDTKRKKFHATVVLAYGELWPNMTEVSCTFDLGY